MEYFSYPDGDPKADQGQAELDGEQSFLYAVLVRLVGDGDTDDNGHDEGEDVGGDDDGASSEQVVGCPIVANCI